jgi:DNA polymerase I
MNEDTFQPPWFLGPAGIDAYKHQDNYVVLDFETTNLLNGLACEPNNRIVLACWTVVCDGRTTEKYKFGDEYELQELVDDINAADFLIAHNAQFELAWLSRCGLDLRSVLCYDTQVMEWVIHGNIRVPYNLNDTAIRYGLDGKESLVAKLIKAKVCPSTIPRSWLLRYCEQDVALTHELFKLQSTKLDQLGLWHIALSRNITIPALVDIHLNGLELDAEAVYKEESKLRETINTIGERLDEITGGINLNSPKQLGIFLYETLGFPELRDRKGETLKTPGGARATAQDVIFQLQASTQQQKEFVELYKEWNNANTLLSKNISFFAKVCRDMGGKFYGLLNHCRTKTHRLASSGIALLFKGDKKPSQNQIQNLPRQFKKLFTSHDPDYEILEADGAGMEFRIATILGKDEQGTYDIVNGTDVHAFTRDTMNVAYEKFHLGIEIDRQEAKSSTFTPLFFGMGKDEAEAEYAKAFKKKYHQIFSTQQQWVMEVADTKKLVTPYGMIFYWPYVEIYRNGYIKYSTEIVNIPIQGLATAEVIPVALVHFWHRTAGMPVEIWNSVHDSIVSRVRKDFMDIAKFHSKLAMTSDVYKFFKDVYKFEFTSCPLGVGMKAGTHWGVSDKEEIYDVWPDGNERYTVDEKKEKRVIYDTRIKQEIQTNDSRLYPVH